MRTVGFLFAALTLTLGCGHADSPVDPGSNPVADPPRLLPPGSNLGEIAIEAFLGGIKLIHLDSGTTQLTTEGRDPSWSPDGKRLVYSTTKCETDWETFYKCEAGGLVLLDMDTRASTVPPAGFIGHDPAWSPNGDEIAFTRYTISDDRLFVMRLDGSPPVEIVVTGSHEVFGPSWSPDGRRIAFFSGFSGRVCVINRDGTGQACLPHPGITPAWRPDGSVLAVTSPNGVVSLMALDGSGVTPLTPGNSPAWSPDGRKIAFRHHSGVWIADPDGSNVQLISSGHFGPPAWRPKR